MGNTLALAFHQPKQLAAEARKLQQQQRGAKPAKPGTADELAQLFAISGHRVIDKTKGA